MSRSDTADLHMRNGPRAHWMISRGALYVLFVARCAACPAQTLELCPNMTAAWGLVAGWEERHRHGFDPAALAPPPTETSPAASAGASGEAP